MERDKIIDHQLTGHSCSDQCQASSHENNDSASSYDCDHKLTSDIEKILRSTVTESCDVKPKISTILVQANTEEQAKLSHTEAHADLACFNTGSMENQIPERNEASNVEEFDSSDAFLQDVQNNQNLELGAACLSDTDENTTQLRFGYSDLSEMKLQREFKYTNQNDTVADIEKDSELKLFNEISYFLPSCNNEVSTDDVPESLSPTTKNPDKDQKCETMFSSMGPSPNSSEESSLDSGIVSLDDQEQTSVSTSPTTETTSGENDNVAAVLDNEAVMRLLANPSSQSGSRKRLRNSTSSSCIVDKKAKRRKSSQSKIVSFKGVTIYYFPRKQSFVTVPSQGGSTLGMSLKHNNCKKMTLNQHKYAVMYHRRAVIKEHKRQQKIDEQVKQLKQSYPNLETAQLMSMVDECDPCEESSVSSSDECYDDDTCDEDHIPDEEEDDYFLQPIPTKKRRLLLRLAGVQRIDSDEKISNKLTRESREICGCDCEGLCLPSHCQCALAGIPCQVDRESFPCGCIASGCHNQSGRVEFDAERVRSHYIHTMRRVRLEETGAFSPKRVNHNPPQPQNSPYVSSVLNVETHIAPDDNGSQAQAVIDTEVATNLFPYEAQTEDDAITCAMSPSTSAIQYHNDCQLSLSNNHVYDVNSFNCAALPDNSAQLQSIGGLNKPEMVLTSPPTSFIDASYAGIGDNSVTQNLIISGQSGSNYINPEPAATADASINSLETYNYMSDPNVFCSHSRYGQTISRVPAMFSHNDRENIEQPFKLDPIASFLPITTSPGRRISQETNLFDSPETYKQLEVVGQPTIQRTSGGSASCSLEPPYDCRDDQTSSRRRSSLSECAPDSIAKA